MYETFVDDYDKFGYLNQSVVLKFLNDNGFPATTKTLAKYSNLGLMMLPKGKRYRETNQSTRTYYCPLAIIEFMTAYILNRGEYKALKSAKRIARFTPQELFAGRIAFFYSVPSLLQSRSYVIESGLCNYNSYSFISPNQYLKVSYKSTVRLNMKDIDSNYIEMLVDYLSNFYQSEELGNATVKYVGKLYGETFQALYDQYIEKILDMPLL